MLRSLVRRRHPVRLVVCELRLPRAVLAALVGAAFGLAGALIQTVARNPLASPDVIGITQGAGLAATIALTTGVARGRLVAPAALAGGLLAAAWCSPSAPGTGWPPPVRARRRRGRVRAARLHRGRLLTAEPSTPSGRRSG